MTPSPLADACEGHFPGDYPAVLPYRVDDANPLSLVAFYRCWCGRAWTCCWNPEAANWPATRTEEAA